ncbi:MAG: hypothetical protein AAGB12_10645 [Pseudomonadota bacterium]
MKIMSILLMLLTLSGCLATNYWQKTLNDENHIQVLSELTEEEFYAYQLESEESSYIDVDTQGGVVYVHRNQGKKILHIGIATLMTPLLVGADAALWSLCYGQLANCLRSNSHDVKEHYPNSSVVVE